jgi:hypothetical protein
LFKIDAVLHLVDLTFLVVPFKILITHGSLHSELHDDAKEKRLVLARLLRPCSGQGQVAPCHG